MTGPVSPGEGRNLAPSSQETLHRDPTTPPASTDSQGDKGPLADLSPQQLRSRLELADASMDAEAWLALLAEVERRCVRAEEADHWHRAYRAILTDCERLHRENERLRSPLLQVDSEDKFTVVAPPASRTASRLTDELIAAAEAIDSPEHDYDEASQDKLRDAAAALRAVRRVAGESQ